MFNPDKERYIMTQISSKPRVKEDTIGEQRMKTLNGVFTSASVEDFKTMCLESIQASSGKPATIVRTCDAINRCSSKSKMLFIVTNYFLAGEGKGV